MIQIIWAPVVVYSPTINPENCIKSYELAKFQSVRSINGDRRTQVPKNILLFAYRFYMQMQTLFIQLKLALQTQWQLLSSHLTFKNSVLAKILNNQSCPAMDSKASSFH